MCVFIIFEHLAPGGRHSLDDVICFSADVQAENPITHSLAVFRLVGASEFHVVGRGDERLPAGTVADGCQVRARIHLGPGKSGPGLRAIIERVKDCRQFRVPPVGIHRDARMADAEGEVVLGNRDARVRGSVDGGKDEFA